MMKIADFSKPISLQIGISILLIAAIGLVSGSIIAAIKLALIYTFFIFLPGLVWTIPLKEELLPTLILSNLFGFAFGFAYLILDVIFNIPLNSITFIIVPVIFASAGLWRAARKD